MWVLAMETDDRAIILDGANHSIARQIRVIIDLIHAVLVSHASKHYTPRWMIIRSWFKDLYNRNQFTRIASFAFGASQMHASATAMSSNQGMQTIAFLRDRISLRRILRLRLQINGTPGTAGVDRLKFCLSFLLLCNGLFSIANKSIFVILPKWKRDQGFFWQCLYAKCMWVQFETHTWSHLITTHEQLTMILAITLVPSKLHSFNRFMQRQSKLTAESRCQLPGGIGSNYEKFARTVFKKTNSEKLISGWSKCAGTTTCC